MYIAHLFRLIKIFLIPNNMNMELTLSQQEAHEEVIKYIKEGAKRIRIVGNAGTGKTTLATKIIETIVKDKTINPNYNNGKVFVTAPTNKALAVITNKVPFNVEFKTIHSALKLKKFIDSKSGHEYFVRNKKIDNEFKNCKVCFIDESSMLPYDIEGGTKTIVKNGEERLEKIYGHLEDFQSFPIIYIGDDKQLPPIGEECSPVFIKDYPEVRLTEIIRQGQDNPIIDLSMDLDMIFFKQPNIINDKGYLYNNDKLTLIEYLCESNGSDEVKYLAYTNADVDSMNKQVRLKLFKNPKKLEQGETIVFNKPFESFYTNQEVKVEDIDIITDYIQIPNTESRFDYNIQSIGSKLDKIKIKYYRVNDSFNVVHESSEKIAKEIYDNIRFNCEKNGWDYRGKEFFLNQFADIKYNHALSVHKSQGSTYKTTIINIQNILFNKNVIERQKMLYTAITRASNLVILNNVK